MTNGAAIGYAIRAARKLGMSDKQIKFFVREMEYQMDIHTEEYAEGVYKEY